MLPHGSAHLPRRPVGSGNTQLLAEEQPVGTLEAALVERVAVCLWRLRRAVTEPMARYQAALDNEWYKAIRALREAQAHRRANAALEGVS